MLDDFEIDYPEDEDFLDEEDGDSGPDRKMLIIGGVLALAILCVIGFIAIWALFLRQPQVAPADQTSTAAAIVATQSRSETEAAIASIPAATYTPLPTEIPTNTPTATATQPEETTGLTATTEGGPTADPRTATVRALLTQAAQAQTQAAEAILTVTATPTSTALPDTGFADDVGIPTLLGMTALLIAVIFVARRLREATA